MKTIERDIVKEFGKQLSLRYSWVDIHRKPSSSGPFRAKLKSIFNYVPILQPEIDICFKDSKGHLFAAEVKVFPAKALSFTLPFYEGIGQALALHRYGFDYVSLWFFFYGEVDSTLMQQYGAQAWSFIRNELKLELDFTFFHARKNKSSYDFIIYQYTSNATAFKLCSFDNFIFKFRHPNPLRNCKVPKGIRSELERWLMTKKSKVAK